MLEVGLGMFSDSNFYAGFEPVSSEFGIFVATLSSLPRGTEVTVVVHLPGAHTFRAAGCVRWRREWGDHDGAPGLGIGLSGLDEAQQKLIRHFVCDRDPLFVLDGELDDSAA